MKYFFKKFLKLPTIYFNSVDEENKICLSMFNIGDLYKLSFTNQRAYFNTIEMLKDTNESDNFDILSIESTEDEERLSSSGFQRRTQIQRLKAIANYLITKDEGIEYSGENDLAIRSYLENLGKKSIFPNTIIVSLNNELQYNKENFIHTLYLDYNQVENTEDYDFFKKNLLEGFSIHDLTGEIYLESLDGEKLQNNIFSQLCFLYDNFLYVPIFELNDDESEIIEYAKKSPLYQKTYQSIGVNKIKEYEQFYKISWIIDGQHRTMSLRYLDDEIKKLYSGIKIYLSKINKNYLLEYFNEERIKNYIYNKSIAVTCYLNSNLGEQADVFLDINNNAKSVDKSLTYDLLPLTAQGITIELAAKKIFDKFNQTKDSPLYKILFNIRGYSKDGGQNVLSQANFINELKYYLKETKLKDRIFFEFFRKKTLTPIYWLIYSFFDKVNNFNEGKAFNEGNYDDKNYSLYRTTGFGALLNFMVAILIENKQIKLESYDEDSFRDNNNQINIIFNEKLSTVCSKIDFSKNSLSSFRGKGGQTELADIMKIFSGLQSINNIDEVKREKIEKQMRIFEL